MPDTSQLGNSIQSLLSAIASGNAQSAQEAIRQFNLSFTNVVAGTYGQNYGLGVPAPPGQYTLPAGQAIGSFEGNPTVEAGGLTGMYGGTPTSAAQQAAGYILTPAQSYFAPGTLVRGDDGRVGIIGQSGQMQSVTSEQLQRQYGMSAGEAQQRIANANTVQPGQFDWLLNAAPQRQATLAAQQAAGFIGGAPTLQQQQLASTNALNQANVTGVYYQPQGTGNLAMDAFNSAGGDLQQQYLQYNGGDQLQAAQHYLTDLTKQLQSQGGQNYNANSVAQAVYGNAAAGQSTLAAQQQAYAQQMGAVNAAAALQASPFRQQQVIGQAGRILQGMPTASFSAPNTVTGVGTVGGNTQGGMGYLSQMIQDIRDPTPNQTSADAFLAQTPTPNKVDSNSFLRAAPSTQNVLLQAMQEKYGIDPQDAMTQIKATLPQFQAPTTMGTLKR